LGAVGCRLGGVRLKCNRKEYEMKKIVAVLIITGALASIAGAHCQIPCGIYDDQARIAMNWSFFRMDGSVSDTAHRGSREHFSSV